MKKLPKSSELNERTTVVVNNETFGDIMFRQIAGALARRLVNYSKLGLDGVQGSDSGVIKFGSRVDLFLPLDTKVLVNLKRNLKLSIFGQDKAIDELSRVVKLSRSGLRDDNKTIGSYLFVGPTGVGKTEIAKVLSSV